MACIQSGNCFRTLLYHSLPSDIHDLLGVSSQLGHERPHRYVDTQALHHEQHERRYQGNELRKHAAQYPCAQHRLLDRSGAYLRCYGLRLCPLQVQGQEDTVLRCYHDDPCSPADHTYPPVYVLQVLQSPGNLAHDHGKVHQSYQHAYNYVSSRADSKRSESRSVHLPVQAVLYGTPQGA